MEHSIEKKYYKISEVAEILGIPASTLRFWESRFTQIKPRRGRGGQRCYTPADVERIRMIHYLVKERGMHIEAAEAQIARNPAGVSRRVEAVERLRQARTRLSELLVALSEPVKGV